jgi:segregation and condensation protein B
MSLLKKIESILFVASKPLSAGAISKAVGKNISDVEESIENLKLKYNTEDSGIVVLQVEGNIQMATNPDCAEVIEGFVKDEVSGELTRAQLETLTVIAYRAPITKPELEQIRGVNCSLIIRNLLVRGLIEEYEDKNMIGFVYKLSFDALAHLGLKNVSELPDYNSLNKHDYIESILSDPNNLKK